MALHGSVATAAGAADARGGNTAMQCHFVSIPGQQLGGEESSSRLAGCVDDDRVFKYNANALHSWMCPRLMLRCALCRVLSSYTTLQGLVMVLGAAFTGILLGWYYAEAKPCAFIFATGPVCGRDSNRGSPHSCGRTPE